MGDPIRALQLDTTVHEIEKHHLVTNTSITGKYIMQGLHQLEALTPPNFHAYIKGVNIY